MTDFQNNKNSIEDAQVINDDGGIEQLDSQEIKDVDEPVRYDITASDAKQGVELCKMFVDSIVAMQMPERLKANEHVAQVLAMHQSMERFTLSSMFKVVAGAIKMLDTLDFSNMYNEYDEVDVHKLNAFMTLQSHLMQTVMTFNMHLRQLPNVIQQAINAAEDSQSVMINVQSNDSESSESMTGIVTSRLPMNALMSMAEQELEEEGLDDYDGIDEDYAGVTKGRIDTGEFDSAGNPIYVYEDDPDLSELEDSDETLTEI